MLNLFGEEVPDVKSRKKEETPLMRQYYKAKEDFPGAILLFRVGDFYETFGEDAVITSKVLGIVLTKRNNGAANETELAGFPHHALDNYLPKLVRAGHRVAICDQLEDPKTAKGIVKRGVTELVTPGVVLNDQVLQTHKNNYLCSMHANGHTVGLAFLDISTGDYWAAQGSFAYAEKLVQSMQPAEVIFAKSQKNLLHTLADENISRFGLDEWVFQPNYAHELLTKQFQTLHLKGFGIEDMPEGIVAAGAVLHYLHITEHKDLAHITSISRLEEEKYMWMDKFTIRNLEILAAQQEGGIPLVEVMDKTVSPMGARLLRRWLVMPLKDLEAIKARQSIALFAHHTPEAGHTVRKYLAQIGDLERIVAKVAAKRITPREMGQLGRSLSALKLLIEEIGTYQLPAEVKKSLKMMHPCDFLCEKIGTELKPDAGIHAHQGNIINDGVNEELDSYRKMAYSGKDYLLQITQREIYRTNIPSLKIQFNKVFGYYLEVTNAHKDKVPADWIRKQTTTHAERYITPELKEYEEKILHAEEKINTIEQQIFMALVDAAQSYVPMLLQNARILAEWDCLFCFAEVAHKNGYTMPTLNEGLSIDVKNARHPVIEQQLTAGEPYIPNDVVLDNATQQIMIITGPNMAGKSALLRQTALIVLMAHIGCFVPASEAVIGLTDKIFSRVGASDNLSKGESTFMVEMTETAGILNNISPRSLLIMDEIGRGTSTYDGISIAWAIVEYLHNHPKAQPKTLFATHYHELTEVAHTCPRVKNFHVSVKESGNKILFLRKLVPGGSEHSFGIHVAQLAGIPTPVVLRAHEIMQQLEQQKYTERSKDTLQNLPAYQTAPVGAAPTSMEKVAEVLQSIDINTLSPLEALLKLSELKRYL